MQKIALIGLFFLLLPAPSIAQNRSLGPIEKPGDARAGTFFIKGTDGHRSAPNVSTDVRVQVTGMIARTEVVQRFTNPTQGWVEGLYVFPLPEDSAVDRLRMRVGERILEGKIQEREKARKTYQKAKSEGRKASLVEQERPNIFTTSVANLGPGESLEVTIAYQEEVSYDQGRFEMRFPMVVAPRYTPSASRRTDSPREDTHTFDDRGEHPQDEEILTDQEGVLEPYEFGAGGWSQPTAELTATNRIQPPVAHPNEARPNPVSISVRLQAGFRLNDVRSPSHPVKVEAKTGDLYEVVLDAGRVPADSDFILNWTPVVGAEPRAALFQEESEGEYYSLLLVMPPKPENAAGARLSRETVFVIDTSGSMQGESMVQAREALDLALSRLRPEDSFNIIRFASTHSTLFARAAAADAQTVQHARDWVRRLDADGGTEMLPALEAALKDDAHKGAVRQIVFITDGAIGNERALFQALEDGLDRSRLFAVGIGSAPNTHFMSKAARFGRGTYTLISSPSEVRTKMNALFVKLDTPVLQDLRVEWDDAHVESWPSRIPDLYVGEPLVIATRTSGRPKRIRLLGKRDGLPVTLELPLTSGATKSGVSRLWARRKIASLVDSIHEGADADRVAQDVTTLGLQHHLVTRWTSLVAVDVTPTKPDLAELKTREVPTLLPKGWTWRGLFGGSAAGTEDTTRQTPKSPTTTDAKPSRTPVNIAMQAAVGRVNQGRLPQGGTPSALLLLWGSGLGATSLLISRFGGRTNRARDAK